MPDITRQLAPTGWDTESIDVTVPGDMWRRFTPGKTRVHLEGDGVDAWIEWGDEPIRATDRYMLTIKKVEA